MLVFRFLGSPLNLALNLHSRKNTNMLSFCAARFAGRILVSGGETQEFKGLGHVFAQDDILLIDGTQLAGRWLQ